MRLTTVCLVSTLALLTYTPFPQRTATPFGQQQTDLRTLMVIVTDKNNAPIDKLDAAAFTVTANKISQEIVEVSQPDSPLSVAIVFDLSGSMGVGGRPSKLSREALNAVKGFVDLSHRANEYVLVGFNDKAWILNEPFLNAIAIVNDLDAMNNLTFEGGSALYDAIHLATNTLPLGKHTRRAILLVSDGFDNKSKANFLQTTRLLKKTDVLVYSIDIIIDKSAGSVFSLEGKSILEHFASISGGRFIQPKVNNLELGILLSQVAAELRGQYLVRFRLSPGLKNKCDEFKVKVIVPLGSKSMTLNSRVKKIACDS